MPQLSPDGYSLPWRQCTYLPLRHAGQIAGLSPAALYKYERDKVLEFRRLGGRTLVTTESLARFLDSAEPYAPSNRGTEGRAARIERARAAWAE